MNGWDILGIFERKDYKDIYIERNNFRAAHKKIADTVHAKTIVERLEKVSI